MTSILSSGIVEVAVCLAFVYLLLSLLCSVVNEWIAGILGSRAQNLEKGIQSLFTGGMLSQKTSLTNAIYEHGLIQSLYQQGFWDRLFRRRGGPSYIAPELFATTLVNILVPAQGPANTSIDSLRAAISNLPDSKGQQALAALLNQGQTDLEQVRKTLEDWYNDGMDRVAGWYKRRTTLVLFFLGLFIALSTNTDSFLIARVLWNNPTLRQATVDAADKYIQSQQPNSSQTTTTTDTTQAAPPSSKTTTSVGISQPTGAVPNTTTAAGSAQPNVTAPNTAIDAKQVKQSIEDLNNELQKLQLPVGWPTATAPPNSPLEAVKRGLDAVGTGLKTLFFAGQVSSQEQDNRAFPTDTGQAWFRVFGWLFTAAALSLGAPFWFDVLNKFMVVRSTVKPKEKSQPEASKDAQK